MIAISAQLFFARVYAQYAYAQRAGVQQICVQPVGFISACVALAVTLIFPIASFAQTTPITSLKEIRERGIVMQQWENSCAAASVATVLTYGFRDPVTERYAAAKMLEKTDGARVRARGGFSLLDLRHFVQDRGYQGDAYQGLSIEDLKIFHAPIVPISTLGYNHYVVFNGISGDNVLLADPAFGHRRMSQKEFSRVWMDGMAFVVTRPSQASPAERAPQQPSPVLKNSFSPSSPPFWPPRVIETADIPPLEIPWAWGLPLIY